MGEAGNCIPVGRVPTRNTNDAWPTLKPNVQEVEKLWKQVEEMSFELARTAVPFDPMADAWIPTSQCVHAAAFCTALIVCYLKMKWPLPDELVEDWRWYESGRWPCGYGVL